MAWEWVDEKYVWREEPDNSCNRCTQDGQTAAYLAPITPGVLLSDEGVRNSIFAESPFSVRTENAEPGCDPAVCMPGISTPDQCPECRAAPGTPHNAECPSCDWGEYAAPPVDERYADAGGTPPPVSSSPHVSQTGNTPGSGNLNSGGPRSRFLMENDAADWEYVPIREDSPKADVPFQTQEWFMDEYFGAAFITIDELVDEHYDLLRKMCHERLREGYVAYGSRMYEWDAKERLRNVLEELADAVVYISSGPVK